MEINILYFILFTCYKMDFVRVYKEADFIKNRFRVFIARMQPIHNAHLWIIEQMLKECENVVIV